MPEFLFTDINEALPVMWNSLHEKFMTIERDSRNGPVLEFRLPVMINYTNPSRRVLLNNTRAANPFFHFFEAMWMLAGRDDVAWLARFLARMKDFSDDGLRFHGAYGKRWWANDGLKLTIEKLRKDPNTRRAFLPIADNGKDIAYEGKDMPCNTGVSFYIRDGELDMTVFNRSNDMLLGALGANYVHFGFLQEFVAGAVVVKVGIYSQVSSCMHLYLNDPVTKKLQSTPPMVETYEGYGVRCMEFPLISGSDRLKQWQADLFNFVEHYVVGSNCTKSMNYFWFEPFFEHVAAPMFRAWYFRNDNRKFRENVTQIQALDWQFACCQWFDRREARKQNVRETDKG